MQSYVQSLRIVCSAPALLRSLMQRFMIEDRLLAAILLIARAFLSIVDSVAAVLLLVVVVAVVVVLLVLLLPAACCLLPAACCLLPAACCLLPAACCYCCCCRRRCCCCCWWCCCGCSVDREMSTPLTHTIHVGNIYQPLTYWRVPSWLRGGCLRGSDFAYMECLGYLTPVR